MSERNKLSVTPVRGDNTLLINGFKVSLSLCANHRLQEVKATWYIERKGHIIKQGMTLQDAVEWCNE